MFNNLHIPTCCMRIAQAEASDSTVDQRDVGRLGARSVRPRLHKTVCVITSFSAFCMLHGWIDRAGSSCGPVRGEGATCAVFHSSTRSCWAAINECDGLAQVDTREVAPGHAVGAVPTRLFFVVHVS